MVEKDADLRGSILLSRGLSSLGILSLVLVLVLVVEFSEGFLSIGRIFLDRADFVVLRGLRHMYLQVECQRTHMVPKLLSFECGEEWMTHDILPDLQCCVGVSSLSKAKCSVCIPFKVYSKSPNKSSVS